jgi:hypothetical protein
LESDKFSADVHEFVKARDDRSLRDDLLRKIHWDCGKPDIDALRKEFEERLIVVGRDLFKLAASEAMRLADVLIYRVLKRSTAERSGARVLTRADLYLGIDEATRVSVPRAAADVLTLIASGLMANLRGGLPVATADPDWLIDGNSLPSSKRFVPRKTIEMGIVDRIQQFGACIVVGASGLGKSSVALSVARNLADAFLMIDFRKAGPEETRTRLGMLLSRVGGLSAQIIIFEDLNHFSDPLVSPSLGRVFEALRRRDRAIIVTSYLPPTAKTFSDVGLDARSLIDVPYFTEEEAKGLVVLYGGDPEVWSRLAYVAGAFGHPQLVNAFVAGASARGWPPSELREIVDRGLSSGDIDAEREAARRGLVSAIPEDARHLLYRLSLTVGHFNRAMALTIANAPPPIIQAGEWLDILIGPWLETVGRNKYRVSPLAAQSGHDIFSPDEQASIHNVIATQFVAGETINGSDVDVILLHAMLGKNEQILVSVANSILTADETIVVQFADNLATFRLLTTDKPLYRDNLTVSVLLRLAQFKILIKSRETETIESCVSALLSEVEDQPREEVRSHLKYMSLSVVLGTIGVGNYLRNWLDLLEQFQSLADSDADLRDLQDNFEKGGESPITLFGGLFAIGSVEISAVASLERIVDQLDALEPARRSLYLSALPEAAFDYGVFINGPWSLESARNAVDAVDAAERYRRMAIKTARWDMPSISVQCSIARAVMLDEYANDSEGALKVLDEADEVNGDNVLLLRARAKIYWRKQDHQRALPILRSIADRVGRNSHVERAFALREAAVSAAKSGEWGQSESWFLESRRAAAESDLPNMKIMAIGLCADAAVAALHVGGIDRALTGLSETLECLASVDPESTLRAFYCHQVVRHSVLWVQSYIEVIKVEIDGSPIEIEPGCCSNPDPPAAIASRPLGSIDLAWYMLAGTEVTSGKNVGIARALYDRLANGPIPVMEIDLRERRVRRDIVSLDASGFSQHLWNYVEGIAHLAQQSQQLRASFSPLNPARGKIPPLSRSTVSDPLIESMPNDAIFAYAITAACRHSSSALVDLAVKLGAEFGENFPAAQLLDRANAAVRMPSASSFDEALMDSVRWFRGTEHAQPEAYLLAGIRFFQQAGRSHFKRYLIAIVAFWQREAWTRIVVSETFRLSRPLRTVPEVKAALSNSEDDEHFLGALFLAAAEAVGVTLPGDLRAEFENLVAAGGVS